MDAGSPGEEQLCGERPWCQCWTCWDVLPVRYLKEEIVAKEISRYLGLEPRGATWDQNIDVIIRFLPLEMIP